MYRALTPLNSDREEVIEKMREEHESRPQWAELFADLFALKVSIETSNQGS